jgi:chemotaxis protein MotB
MRGRFRVEANEDFWPAYTDILMVTTLILILLVVTFVISRQDDSVPRELERRKEEFRKAFKAKLGTEAARKQVFLFSPPGERQTISFSDALLFDQGDARLTKPAGIQALSKVAGLLRSKASLYKTINVNGHTDIFPIQTPQFPSNWHLSSARATSVVYYLVGSGLSPRALSARGFAEFRPYDPNGNLITSQARKRRIEIEVEYPLQWISDQISGQSN